MTPRPRTYRLLAVALFAALCTCRWELPGFAQDSSSPPPDRKQIEKALKDGNWKSAYDGFRALVLDPKAEASAAPLDLQRAAQALLQLGRLPEYDALLEDAVKAHPDQWRLLWAAAQLYAGAQPHGTIIAGKFERGPHRGGDGKFVYTFERDRARSLQLFEEARRKAPTDEHPTEFADLLQETAQALTRRYQQIDLWRLQELSDLSQLPDHEDAQTWHGWWADPSRGAPVNADASPVYYRLPASFEEAKNDGERWRWCHERAAVLDPARAPQIRFQFALFLRNMFDVHTLAAWGWRFDDEDEGNEAKAAYAVDKLPDDETIARLAGGVKRFKLPDEFAFVKILLALAETPNTGVDDQALQTLAQVFADRRQYPRAAQCWKTLIQRYGPNSGRQQQLDQIEGSWGQFEPVSSQPAGRGATVDFRFRNGNAVDFEAHEIDLPKLLAAVKGYIKGRPKQLDWQHLDIQNLGYRLVTLGQENYLKGRVAGWHLDLQPRPAHFDRRVTVSTPLQKPGAYLVTSRMADGNVSRIVLWVADTVLVKKPLEQAQWCFVADAVTGRPIPHANVEFFGYRQRYVQDNQNNGHYEVDTQDFAEHTDDDGQVVVTPRDEREQYQWIVLATTPEEQGSRLAYLGFTGLWWNQGYDQAYNQVKTFGITDRPVYRPDQTVKWKAWVGQAQYDQEGGSPYAGQSLAVQITNPKGENVSQKSYTCDSWGGMHDELVLPADAPLGVWTVYLPNTGGSFQFRVEEYKKPEFQVLVEAPEEPIALGEKITAKITAKYYFGAPVGEGKVKYKVLRTPHTAQWFPYAWWDWFYGPGYWWFACDYPWYPGWREWGCRRPYPWWWWQLNPPQPPEVVAEVETAIGADGVVNVEIDTGPAKAMHGDEDHRYEITAEVTDPSRRVIVGQGTVLVARKPFKVYSWVDRGHYRVGDTVEAGFRAQRLDAKPVQGKGVLRLLSLKYDAAGNPQETEVQKWTLDTDAQGDARQQIKAVQGGQYRLSFAVTDSAGHVIEGGYVFTVAGEGFNEGADFRFNAIELIPDQREYRAGETAGLQINVNRTGGTVLLFARPSNGVYKKPTVLRLRGKSIAGSVAVSKQDMPNFYLEAVTVADGRVHTDVRELIVPPESRVSTVEISPSKERYRPGEKAKFKLRAKGPDGKPFKGSLTVTMYDKALEYISGGSNVPDIREFFWKWRRQHQPGDENSLNRWGGPVLKNRESAMGYLGVFGAQIEELGQDKSDQESDDRGGGRGMREKKSGGPQKNRADPPGAMAEEGMAMGASAPESGAPMGKDSSRLEAQGIGDGAGPGAAPQGADLVQPTVRTNFADSAYWAPAIETGPEGEAEFELVMPENLTAWKTRAWSMGAGTRVGEATIEVVTVKDLIVRLQAPRFFVQKDEVVLSANVHNYLKSKKQVKVTLALAGNCLESLAPLEVEIEVDPNGQKRVDWRCKVVREGEATVTMAALTDEESDAMKMTFPAYVHGMLKTDSFSGVLRPDRDSVAISLRVPAERRPEQSRLEVRYSPTLAGAMVDALPYLADYPYGCTEQTLNRFLPSVITQRILIKMGLDLAKIAEKRTNLNAQEIGDDRERAKDWARTRRWDRNPVYDAALLRDMVKSGVNRLTSMQCADGGWGWFSGYGEQSWAHTTAYVVHGLQIARDNDVALVPGVLERGIEWLRTWQQAQLALMAMDPPRKQRADALDAFAYMVLVDANIDEPRMRDALYRDRNELPVYAKTMFALALHATKQSEKLAMLRENIEQYLVQDAENQTAYLRLPGDNWWWAWYGSENEAQAYYLKLLSEIDPKGETASRLVKYLLNNRKHGTYWNSTRDTAICIEAMADFLTASGEDTPDMTVELWLGDKKVKEARITKDNLFEFDNALVLEGKDLTDGEHKLEVRRKGKGPVYFNAYLTNFTLEDPIGAAGLEIKVGRKLYKLERVDKSTNVEGAHGQVVSQKVEKYKRIELGDGAVLKSGDLVEVELEIDSKNDYEYVLFEDMKAAGFEPVEVRSGYNGNDLNAYVEFHDERVGFFARVLARGKHSVSYRLRAEIPGKFSALPAKASAMYAPELKANSSEAKVAVED